MGKISKKLQNYQAIFETTIHKIYEMEMEWMSSVKHSIFVNAYDLLKKENGWPSKCPIQFIGVSSYRYENIEQFEYIFKCQKSKTIYFIGMFYHENHGLNTNMEPHIVKMRKVTYLRFEETKDSGSRTDILESECENI